MIDPNDPNKKNRVLTPNARGILKKELWYVQRGLLSDIPGMTMYYKVGVLSTGFKV